MFLNGAMRKMVMWTNLIYFSLASILVICGFYPVTSAMAEGFNLETEDYFKEAKPDNTYISSDVKFAEEEILKADQADVDAGSVYVSGSNQVGLPDNKKKTPAVIVPIGTDVPSLLEGEKEEGLNPHHHSSIRGMDSVDSPTAYGAISNREMIRKVAWKTNSAFGMSYFAVDNFEYHDSNNIYNRVFRDGTKSKSSGLILFSSSKYFARGFLDLKWGLNIGAKYNSGYGLFPGGDVSESRFTLWSIPVDLSLGFEIPLSRFIKFSGSAGPSVMGLIQARNDRDYGEDGKHTRQVGTGYFASAQALIGLSSIFPKYGVEMLNDYSVGQTQLSFEGRMVKYQNFQDEITVDGTSFGVGIIFEFL